VARLAYLDTSALVKLVAAEPETRALEHDVVEREGLLSSRLAATELRRAAARSKSRAAASQVDELLESVYLMDITPAILESAGELKPVELRTLDAIHLASALSVASGPIDFITYDERQAAAARRHGLSVIAPGR
jgi:predicted nucleic acid-binding protein